MYSRFKYKIEQSYSHFPLLGEKYSVHLDACAGVHAQHTRVFYLDDDYQYLQHQRFGFLDVNNCAVSVLDITGPMHRDPSAKPEFMIVKYYDLETHAKYNAREALSGYVGRPFDILIQYINSAEQLYQDAYHGWVDLDNDLIYKFDKNSFSYSFDLHFNGCRDGLDALKHNLLHPQGLSNTPVPVPPANPSGTMSNGEGKKRKEKKSKSQAETELVQCERNGKKISNKWNDSVVKLSFFAVNNAAKRQKRLRLGIWSRSKAHGPG